MVQKLKRDVETLPLPVVAPENKRIDVDEKVCFESSILRPFIPMLDFHSSQFYAERLMFII